MLEREKEKWVQDQEPIKLGAFRYFRTTLPQLPADPFFWRTRESSKIFVEHAWPGADYK